MAALIVLLAAALALVVLGVLRHAPPPAPGVVAGVGVVAAAVAALSPPAGFGLGASVDGVSAVPLLGVFLLAGVGGVSLLPAGLAALALLAADGVGLTVACVLLVLLAGPGAHRFAGPGWARAAGLALALGVAVLALGGTNPSFAAMNVLPGSGPGAVLLVAAVAAGLVLAVSVPELGGLLAAYLVARLLLDLPGPVSPGWWGGPVLLLGGGLGAWGAQRAAGAGTLSEGVAGGGLAAQGMAVMALGAALLARGMDVLPLASMAVAGAWLLLLAWVLGAGVLGLGAGVVERGCGPGLARAGGVLRRAPVTGLSLLAGLGAMAALPLTPGFAGAWLAVQAMLGVGRSGGVGVLMLMAGAVAGLGLVAALTALAALRLAGMVLLGVPRSGGAANLVEPALAPRLVLGALVAALAVLGLVPGLGLLVVQQAALVLAAGALGGAGWFAVGLPDVPGYAAPGLALLLAVLGGAVAWSLRGAGPRAAPWQGGFVEDGVGRGNAGGLAVSARRFVPHPLLAVLALALAVLLGWAAR